MPVIRQFESQNMGRRFFFSLEKWRGQMKDEIVSLDWKVWILM